MMDDKWPWIEFKGRRSTDIAGLVVTSLPPPAKPAQRRTATTVPGRDGVLNILDNSAEPISQPVTLFAYNRAAADAATEWLSGSGNLILSTYPDRVYSVTVFDAYSWTEDADIYDTFTATVTFSVHPYPQCDIAAEYTVPSGDALVIRNSHNADAYPLITVIRTVDDAPIKLSVGTLDVLNVTDGGVDTVVIDCDIMECYDGSRTQINEYCREYPVFAAGKEYTIRVSGGNAYIQPRWRCRA